VGPSYRIGVSLRTEVFQILQKLRKIDMAGFEIRKGHVSGPGGGHISEQNPENQKQKYHPCILNLLLAASTVRDPSCHHSRECERDYSGIAHPGRPIPAMLNRKAE
jgi:hypothetical protein